jgi:hypothetical protein
LQLGYFTNLDSKAFEDYVNITRAKKVKQKEEKLFELSQSQYRYFIPNDQFDILLPKPAGAHPYYYIDNVQVKELFE